MHFECKDFLSRTESYADLSETQARFNMLHQCLLCDTQALEDHSTERAMNTQLNGIDVSALKHFSESVATNPAAGQVHFNVKTQWQGQTRTVGQVNHFTLGDDTHQRKFEIVADEPPQLLGADTAPNPQELLMAALNACLSVGYVANAAAMGITVHSLEIETDGMLDLRGFLGLDESINAGYDAVRYVVRISTDAPHERVMELHQAVTKTSPNLTNFSKAIQMNSTLEIV